MSPDTGSIRCLAGRSLPPDLLTLQAARRRVPLAGCRQTDLDLHDNSEVDRASVEAFIRNRFHETFGARVDTFMPRLLSLRDAEDRICGAFGLRGAHHPLFLEQYIDTPIESEIEGRTGMPCVRQTIVEVGHLSGAQPGAVRTMIELLTRRLHEEGVLWVTFTGTASLRNAFHRMGLLPVDMAPAAIERLPAADRSAWGRYYEDAPRVFFGNVQEGHRMLSAGSSRSTAACLRRPAG